MRKYLIAGILIWLPILGTFAIVRFLVNLLDRSLALLPYAYQPDQLFGRHIPGVGLVFTFIIVFLTGLILTNFIGHKVVALWEKLLSRIPVVRSLHTAFKQVTHAVLKPGGESFRKVVLVEYPRRGMWSIAFQTSNGINKAAEGRQTITVFIPTTPNPTSGFLFIVPSDDVLELDISIEEAFKMIISLGVVTPEHLAPERILDKK